MVSRRSFLRGSLGIATGLAGTGYYFHDVTTGRYTIEDVPIKTKLLNDDLYGLKILIVTDLHIGAHNMTLEHLDDIVDAINDKQPDVVLLAGDYILANRDFRSHTNYTPSQITDALEKIKAPKAAVLGNHDLNRSNNMAARLTQAFDNSDIPLLRNQSIRLDTDKGKIWIAGLDNMYGGLPDYAATMMNVPDDEDVIYLTHSPDGFALLRRNAALAVAGDTHCGQVIGRSFADAVDGDYVKTREDWYCGEYSLIDGAPAYVSGGIGTSGIPARVFVPSRSEMIILEPH